jgi:chromosomal replication initiator protein
MLTTGAASVAQLSSPWQACLARIQEQVGPSSFETWFRTTDLALLPDGRACIQVPNQFFADFIEEHFGELVRQVLKEQLIDPTDVCFVPTERDWKIVEPISESIADARERSRPRAVENRGQFHPNYAFGSFVVGDSNRMAHAACLAVAEAPGKTTFNPLVIYGGTGLGKTHLLQAIGHFAQTEDTAESVAYLTSEEFTRQYIDYVIHRHDSTSFYRRFNDVDLLLIDDIHFLSGKQATQKEFYRIFNRLLRENKQIVLTSDRPPDRIPDMMEHIINRFQGGLISDVQPPNLETRMAILQKKAETDGVSLPDEVTAFLAAHITSNVRELEGILIKLVASSSFTGRDITLAVAHEICGDLVRRRQEPLSVKCIQERVAEAFGVSANQLSAHTRRRDVTLPRSVAMYLCRKLTKQSLTTIGLEFGGRDYSTVIHASKKIEADIAEDAELRGKVEHLERVVLANGGGRN